MGFMVLGLGRPCGRLETPRHPSIDVRVHGKKRQNSKKRDYGSGRADMNNGSESMGEGPGVAEYLHFGRLIGERADESKDRLGQSSVDVSKDPRAELYLEKWSQEEEMSYSMFETLLDGGDPVTSAVKDISFDDIMRDSDEVIQAAFERIARHEDQPTKESTSSSPVARSFSSVEETVPPPTYDAFKDLLDPQMKNEESAIEESPKQDEEEEKRQRKRQHNVAKAISLSSKNVCVEAKVWRCNASGVLVDADGVTGFVPFNQLDEAHAAKVVSAQGKARISLGGPRVDDAAVRKGGMTVLMGTTLNVKILRIDQDLGRVIFTEKTSGAQK